MRFSNILPAVLTALAFSARVKGNMQQTKDALLNPLIDITGMTQNLNILVASINVVNVVFKGPKVSQGLVEISNTISNAVNNIPNPPTVLDDANARDVIKHLHPYNQLTLKLMDTLIGKHGILSLLFFAQPVHAALVSLEGSIDSFAFAFTENLPTQATAVNKDFNSLDVALSNAINVYS